MIEAFLEQTKALPVNKNIFFECILYSSIPIKGIPKLNICSKIEYFFVLPFEG